MLNIAILALDNCIQSTVSGPFDIFTIADMQVRELFNQNNGFCKVEIVAPSKETVIAFNGLSITTTATICDNIHYDIVLTPALLGDYQKTIENEDIIEWLIAQHQSGTCICSICASSFLVARAGLLSGKNATTHWGLTDKFRKEYPDVILKPEKMLVDEGDVISAGGVTAYLDLCLYIIRKFGSRELAVSISKTLLIDSNRESQAPYSRYQLNKNHGDKNILCAQKYIESEYKNAISLENVAEKAMLSIRTLNRRFKASTGDTPSEYLQAVRIEAARYLLESTAESVDEITVSVGYEDTSSFRRLFKAHTRLTPTEYRKRFSAYNYEL
ncbi:GlxA family transcriptional regulator [Desulforhopalus sp. 52FAK]